MIVADASPVIDLLMGGASPAADALAVRLRRGDVVCAPYLIDAEVGQGLRRFSLRGEVSAAAASAMVTDFLDLPIYRYPHGRLLARAFELRANATIYDGLYLALAEVLECSLLTGDQALVGVPGCAAVVEVFPTSA